MCLMIKPIKEKKFHIGKKKKEHAGFSEKWTYTAIQALHCDLMTAELTQFLSSTASLTHITRLLGGQLTSWPLL